MELLNKLSNQGLIVGLLIMKFENDKVCDACQIAKQTKGSFKSKNHISLPLDLWKIDLFDLTRTLV